jgi:SOS response regulatory protein OraA/RecX
MATALEHAKKLLAGREKTTAQVRAALERKGFSAGEIDEAIERLRGLSFLDDRRAAESLARTALTAHQSRSAVARKLEGLGVDESVVERAVIEAAGEVGHDDERAARALLSKRRLTGLKAARFLAGRGFDEALIRRVVGLAED